MVQPPESKVLPGAVQAALTSWRALTICQTDVVKTVGASIVVIGIALIAGAKGVRSEPGIVCLGIFSPLAVAGVDICYGLRGVIRKF
ncbi:MAG TPA: hypothetical protein VIT91_01655, partial [Chthoniobacterales bacterium]